MKHFFLKLLVKYKLWRLYVTYQNWIDDIIESDPENAFKALETMRTKINHSDISDAAKIAVLSVCEKLEKYSKAKADMISALK